jgi:hypothetical protein
LQDAGIERPAQDGLRTASRLQFSFAYPSLNG